MALYGSKATAEERNLAEQLEAKDRRNVALAIGGPGTLRRELDELRDEGIRLGAIATAGPAGMQVIRDVPDICREFSNDLCNIKGNLMNSSNRHSTIRHDDRRHHLR